MVFFELLAPPFRGKVTPHPWEIFLVRFLVVFVVVPRYGSWSKSMNPLEPWILIVFSGPKKGGIAWEHGSLVSVTYCKKVHQVQHPLVDSSYTNYMPGCIHTYVYIFIYDICIYTRSKKFFTNVVRSFLC